MKLRPVASLVGGSQEFSWMEAPAQGNGCCFVLCSPVDHEPHGVVAGYVASAEAACVGMHDSK